MGVVFAEILRPVDGFRGMSDDVLPWWQGNVKIIGQPSQKVDAMVSIRESIIIFEVDVNSIEAISLHNGL